jgi:hypothetical protein
MQAACCDHDGHGEEHGEEAHANVWFVTFCKEPNSGDEAGRKLKGEEGLRAGSQQGSGAQHHPTDDKGEDDLVNNVPRGVEENPCCSPRGPIEGGAEDIEEAGVV